MNLATLANPAMREIGPAGVRGPQQDVGLKLPTGTTVVSADSHWEITDDIFYEYFPQRLKDKAPRVWFDKYWRIGYRNEKEAFAVGEKAEAGLVRSTGQGVWDFDIRYRDMDTEGVEKELVFPHSLLGFARFPELEVQEHLYRAYNEYMGERSRKSGGRSYGVGIFSNWWDPAAAERSMQQIVDLGLKTFMVPVTPGKSIVDNKNMAYGDAVLDRFWDVVDAAGLPVSFHVGEGIDTEHRGGLGATVLHMMAPFRRPFGELVFGGVFDRHPDLQIVFAEGGIAWIAPALQDAEMVFDSFGNDDLVEHLNHRPSHYWHNNCYATFQNDLLGLGQLDHLGAGRVMWASDYPHSEGSLGYGWKSLQSVVDATSSENARAILGETATRVYNLDAD
jgi:predicted TIM-barrel fold metal-dependent hydrolase